MKIKDELSCDSWWTEISLLRIFLDNSRFEQKNLYGRARKLTKEEEK